MSLLASLWSAFSPRRKSAPAPENPPRNSLRLRMALAGALPGYWSSSHLNEASRCEGWQFVAVRALARMGSQAELQVHEVGTRREQRQLVEAALRFAESSGQKRQARYWRKRLDQLKSRRHQKAPPTASGVRTPRRHVSADHPLYRLMQRVNPEWSLPTFCFAALQQWALTGSCYVWLIRDALNYPRELYVLPTGLLTQRAPTAAYPAGSYYLSPLSTFGLANPSSEWEQGTLGSALMGGREIDFRQVKAVRWPHPLNLSDGLSPLHAVRLWVDVSNQIDMANFARLWNAARIGETFEQSADVDPHPDDVEAFQEWLRSEYSGPMNSGKPFLFPKGITRAPQQTGVSDVEFPTGQTTYQHKNLAAHGVSPIACGIAEAGSLAMYRAALKQTTELSVQPALNLLAGELTELLGSEFDGPRCEVGLHAPSVNDPQELEQRLRTDVQAGNVLRVNEYRALRGLPPIAGELGMQFVGQKTTVKVEDADPEKPGVQSAEGDGNGRADSRADESTDGESRDAEKHLTNGHAHNGNGRRW